ncbi:MAG TPA: ATP synthase F1 subunit delta [Acidimicrobiales bacterium]
MRNLVWGYGSAVLETARDRGQLQQVGSELTGFARALDRAPDLLRVLTDPAVPVHTRRAVVEDLLLPRVSTETVRLVSYATATERATDLPSVVDELAQRVVTEAAQAEAPAEPPAGRAATRERLHGYAAAVFEEVEAEGEAPLEECEDELFRLARVIEGSDELGSVVTNPELPVATRLAIVDDLLAGRVQSLTQRLVRYALRTGRGRDLVATLDWLVDRAAAERNLKVADVRAAVDLDEDQRSRLAEALSRVAGRSVEVRVTPDPSLIAGMVAVVGDLLVDGSVRHRLEQLKIDLSKPDTMTGHTGERR